jgi:CBS-domain-containing membrane protein
LLLAQCNSSSKLEGFTSALIVIYIVSCFWLSGGRPAQQCIHDASIIAAVTHTRVAAAGPRRFIFMNKTELGDLASKTAAELGWASRPVVTLGPDVSAIEAMLLMNERQISALAVVDGVGKIIGNFSVSEMRCGAAEQGM